MADSLAVATTPIERAELLMRILTEVEDIVRWGSIAGFPTELMSLKSILMAGRRHQERSAGWVERRVPRETDEGSHPPSTPG